MNHIQASRYHDISCGHRVAGHESKCAHLHGHNYRITFTCAAQSTGPGLDALGRVIDFSVIKERLCIWVEEEWDHKFLAWDQDELMQQVAGIVAGEGPSEPCAAMLSASIVWTPFNPTAENLAEYLLKIVGPARLSGTGVRLIAVEVEETRKCSAVAVL